MRTGAKVTIANNCVEAADLARTRSFDLVLMDPRYTTADFFTVSFN